MTQEEKEILLKYLCMALPYNVKCNVPTEDCVMTLTGKRLNYFCFHKDEWGIDYSHEIETVLDPLNDHNNDYVVKPYLRPMSSMTEEEKNEHFGRTMTIDIVQTSKEVINWLLKNHFDFLGLISKGLANEVTESNNPYEE